MTTDYEVTNYVLSDYSTLDDDHGFGPEICTSDQYAYILLPEIDIFTYVPQHRPGDFLNNRVVSAVNFSSPNIKILTLGDMGNEDDLYIFCEPIRFQRIGVIRRGSDIMENLPRHPQGGQTWGYCGGGPGNTCDVIWGDIIGKQSFSWEYPKGLGTLFDVKGVLPQDAHFAISATVIKLFAEKSG